MSRPGKMTYAPLYFEEFKGGCEDLTNEQIGVYLRVLFEIYEEMGPIAFDQRRLSKRLNCRPHKARSLVSELVQMRKLYLTSTGQISNHRAESEIAKFVSISVQNRLNGKSSKKQTKFEAKKLNENNNAVERTLSGRETILEERIYNNNSTLEGSALPREAVSQSRPSSKSVEEFVKRRQQVSQRRGGIRFSQ